MIQEAIHKFQELPPIGKFAVIGVTSGVAIFGVVVANKRAEAIASSNTTSNTQGALNGGTALDPTQLFSNSGLFGTPGSTDSLTANGPLTTPTGTTGTTKPPSGQTGMIPLPAQKATSGLSNNFHIITVGSATQFKTLDDIAKYANHGKSSGYWNPSTVYHYRNNAQIFQALGMTVNGKTKIPAASVQISI